MDIHEVTKGTRDVTRDIDQTTKGIAESTANIVRKTKVITVSAFGWISSRPDPHIPNRKLRTSKYWTN